MFSIENLCWPLKNNAQFSSTEKIRWWFIAMDSPSPSVMNELSFAAQYLYVSHEDLASVFGSSILEWTVLVLKSFLYRVESADFLYSLVSIRP